MSAPLFILDRTELRERELGKRIQDLETSARAAFEAWKYSPARKRDPMLAEYMEDLNAVVRGKP